LSRACAGGQRCASGAKSGRHVRDGPGHAGLVADAHARDRAGSRAVGCPRSYGGPDMVTAGAWVDAFIDRVERDHAVLTDLDRRAGDGDFGDNLLASVRRARRGRDAGAEPFGALVAAFREAGGTSGPLLGMWFRPF